jgi:hypothetical protein
MLARWAILAMAVTTLGGCGSISSSLGLERHVPDESQVVVRPALTLPPDYDLMPPGTPTPVSSDHENGLSKGGQEISSDATQPKPERGFFSRVFDFDWFGGDSDKSPSAPSPSSTEPGPNIDGTPRTPPPSQPAPAAQSTPSNDPGPNIDGTPQAPAKSSGLDVRPHLAAAALGDTLNGERSGNDLAAA